jgi:hypothetical protein
MELRAHLLGKWQLDAGDIRGRAVYGETTLDFLDDGTLVYTEHEGAKQQISILTYRIEDGWIVTNQPSQPRIEKTPFELTDDGKLVLVYGGITSVYVKR